MKISIITIVYNNSECIEDCINSVLKQTYNNIEHIVIDGGSKDNTVEIINKYKDKISYFISEKDNGLYDALNKGIKAVTGDIIGILHSDDLFFYNDTLSNIVSVFEKSNADLVYAKGQYVDRTNINLVKRIYPSKPFKKIYLYFGWIPLHTTIYVKKEIFDNYGKYQTNYKIASDYEISLRWFFNDKIKKIFLNDWVVKMRLGGKSTTISLQKLKSNEDLKIISKYNLLGYFTLFCKIARKIPQYLIPKIFRINS